MLGLLALAVFYFEIYARHSDLYIIFLGAGALLITKIAVDSGADKGRVTISLGKPARSVNVFEEKVLLEAIGTALKENEGCIHFNDLKEHLAARLGLKSVSKLEDEELRHFLALQDSRLLLKFYGVWVLGPECEKCSIGIAAIRRGEGTARRSSRTRKRNATTGMLAYSRADLSSYRKLQGRESATLLLLPGRDSSRKLVDDIARRGPVGLVTAVLVCCKFAKVVYC
ncbi:MAG: hypothetical protein UNLARM2_0085 [Candidatus Micrarchaeum acidiphilum ARMAN-2]|jgi:hypothetical protein|uniref:Uncharacterized protein n=1 Tax=Candidatus Micrarchaeum acidiphilum ARMAN-2 TaxID=425595 RepID=C7DG81_MICA2|nr:MAG: hypothetical protein UNLARM2_0085 [Candidatus Micrarchaeum acidiphilum ARMAN-2]